VQLREGKAEGLTAPPRSIVSLVPSVTASLFDLGLGDRLVGVTDYCVYPHAGVAALPKVGGTKNPAVERVLALAPDLVIANREENRAADVAAIAAAGVPVWVTFPCTVRAALDWLWELIRLCDAPRAGQIVAALERSYEITRLAAAGAARARVFCPIWREPAAEAGSAAWWMTANQQTYLHDVLAVCGGDNVFATRERRYPLAADLDRARPPVEPPDGAGDTRYPRVTLEEIVAAAPDVIVLPSEPYPFGEADRAELNGHTEIPAVQAGRVYGVDGSLPTWPGTRLAAALAELPSLICPPASV
jgi:ABC-type Fe3+-hydroxamate transport system substrate-binding protein